MMKDEMIDNRETSSNKMKDDFIRHLCPSMVSRRPLEKPFRIKVKPRYSTPTCYKITLIEHKNFGLKTLFQYSYSHLDDKDSLDTQYNFD